jgi:hypothetical protein
MKKAKYTKSIIDYRDEIFLKNLLPSQFKISSLYLDPIEWMAFIRCPYFFTEEGDEARFEKSELVQKQGHFNVIPLHDLMPVNDFDFGKNNRVFKVRNIFEAVSLFNDGESVEKDLSYGYFIKIIFPKSMSFIFIYDVINDISIFFSSKDNLDSFFGFSFPNKTISVLCNYEYFKQFNFEFEFSVNFISEESLF